MQEPSLQSQQEMQKIVLYPCV